MVDGGYDALYNNAPTHMNRERDEINVTPTRPLYTMVLMELLNKRMQPICSILLTLMLLYDGTDDADGTNTDMVMVMMDDNDKD